MSTPYTGTSQDRANFAIRVMLAGRATTRAFDGCFEMGDQDEVAAIVYRRALRNPRLMAVLPRYLVVDLCKRNYEERL